MSIPVSRVRAAIRGTRFLLSCLFSFSLYALLVGPLARWRRPLQESWCRAMLSFVGMKIRTFDAPQAPQGPILYVVNHLSYIDIPVLSSVITGTFIAKAEVSNWPLLGFAARITGTIFINRISGEARQQREQMHRRLMSGEPLILFPEGTSTDGSGVAPFKSALFSLAEGSAGDPGVIIQPVSIAYTRALDGTPLVGPLRELYCWFGEGTLAPHLWRMLGMRGCHVEMRFMPPIHSASAGNRKELARLAQAAVATGVAASNAPLLAEVAGTGALPAPVTDAATAASV